MGLFTKEEPFTLSQTRDLLLPLQVACLGELRLGLEEEAFPSASMASFLLFERLPKGP